MRFTMLCGVLLARLAVAQSADTSLTKQRILAAEAKLAAEIEQHGHSALLAALDPSAVVLIPDQPILGVGPELERAIHARYDAPSVYRWMPLHVVASTDGHFGCTIGTSTFEQPKDSVRGARNGYYTTCWRVGDDGTAHIVGVQRRDWQSMPAKEPPIAVLEKAPHSATVAGDGNVRQETLDTETRFGLMGGNGADGPGAAFVSYAAPDAVLMPGDGIAYGKAEIERGFARWDPNIVLEWGPDRRFGAGSGGLAFTVGNSITYERTGAKRVFRRGHFLTVWRKETDGRWLYISDLGSPRPPLADGR
jgi:ketosteroid isomerase-like protein